MPIPDFDASTSALPPGDHPATLEEVRKRLATTRRRRHLMTRLEWVIEQLRANGVTEIYLDGSFTTEDPRPGDVDVVYVVPAGADPARWADELAPSKREELKILMDVDLLPSSAIGDQGQPIKEFFAEDRDGRAKGLVALREEARDDPE